MSKLRPWGTLTTEEQLQLRESFGHYLDRLPPTCSMDDKLSRFQQWLAERGIAFERSDLAR